MVSHKYINILIVYFLIILDLAQNDTLEERVSLLEIQVVLIEDDVTDLEANLMELEGDVNFLFDDQIIQDERLFSLEQDNDVINQDLESESL